MARASWRYRIGNFIPEIAGQQGLMRRARAPGVLGFLALWTTAQTGGKGPKRFSLGSYVRAASSKLKPRLSLLLARSLGHFGSSLQPIRRKPAMAFGEVGLSSDPIRQLSARRRTGVLVCVTRVNNPKLVSKVATARSTVATWHGEALVTFELPKS
jgi:hypothetical protein